ncbi:unnamed protein product, partial [Ectocarpus sp. 12 AP-2014]
MFVITRCCYTYIGGKVRDQWLSATPTVIGWKNQHQRLPLPLKYGGMLIITGCFIYGRLKCPSSLACATPTTIGSNKSPSLRMPITGRHSCATAAWNLVSPAAALPSRPEWSSSPA